jgi:hypothetical protein
LVAVEEAVEEAVVAVKEAPITLAVVVEAVLVVILAI